MFATNARPDIQYTVSQLARCMAWPDANIEAAAERCLIYLIGTQDLGLHYERVADPKLFGCSDANWCTRQSTSGCAFKIGTAIIWKYVITEGPRKGHIGTTTQATFCVNELWNGIEYRAPTTDLPLTDIEGAWPELVTADETPDESDKATLDNNVTRGDSVFLPTTDNHAGGLTLDEEVVIMPEPWQPS